MEIAPRIRPVTKKEAMSFRNHAWKTDFDLIYPGYLDCEVWARANEFYASESDGITVGVIGLKTSPPRELVVVYVLRKHGRRGIGSSLCTFALNRFQELGPEPVFCFETSDEISTVLDRLPSELTAILCRRKEHSGIPWRGDEFTTCE